ncbi:hypothetical protein GWO43_09990 [candidate division KSB1 bacterium]|nr:hypothetical protein [candidate division KSB1 bacterium]NIR69528.1 hypothetical protein [candidate division KSB1 bacterium]NIS24296.1 hypothetical protein [candidate division KSB1 bacterium]NIT71211.1 hypothetical protein [candidate division KSB1 bacterium]NIU24915.1 hypothetical protein [candidate division KSB1 bacterium]
MKRRIYVAGLVSSVLLMLTSCNLSINKTVRVRDGETRNSGINTVNGGIIIGDNCEVRGDCHSVNGKIDVGRNSKVEELQTVNGGIRIDEGSMVYGSLESVNGSVTCDAGVTVEDEINTINGKIRLYNTRVEENITTINGDISLKEKSVVVGDIIIKDSKGTSGDRRRLRITLEGESVVEGDIMVKEADIDVEVILSGDSKVMGRIENAEVIEEETNSGTEDGI